MRLFQIYRRPYVPKINVFGEGEEDGGGTNNEQNNQNNDQNDQNTKKFSQADVNRMINQDKDKTKKDNARLLAELRSFQERGFTQENLEALQGRITELENLGKTQEQIANERQQKLSKDYENKLTSKTQEAESWKNNYITYRLDSEIKSAAANKKARNADQVLAILKPNSSIREVLGDDKKPTGSFDTRVKWREVDKDGKPIELDLSITEAVDRMAESPDHANLFDSGTNGGLGGFNSPGRKNGEKDPGDMTMDEYMAWRKKNKAR